MGKKLVCEFCDEVFKTKAKLIKHIKEERDIANEMALNAEDDVLECDRILDKLEGKKAKVVK